MIRSSSGAFTRLAALVLLTAIGLLVGARPLDAHESRPAYLEIKETAPGRYTVLWRTPQLSGMRLPVAVVLPAQLRNETQPIEQDLGDSYLTRWVVMSTTGSLEGLRIAFPGLAMTITDVLVRIEFQDGTRFVTLVHPSRPYLVVAARSGLAELSATYIEYGMQHILFGIDHLLFVLGLLLLVHGAIPLLKTITAFTVAHSITLAVAALGLVRVPPPPVEAVIALSIVFLATELAKQARGEVGLAQRHPWVIAFAFGLLHGFGFAGTLTRVGLPRGDIPLALFTFNVGVELGQLVFVTVVLSFVWSLRSLAIKWPRWTRPVPAYAIGIIAASWFIQRVVGFW